MTGFLRSGAVLAYMFIQYSVGLHGQVIVTLAGNGTSGHTGDGGLAILAELNFPNALATDAAGNIYVSDAYNNCIRRIDHTSGIITTVAGNGSPGYTGDGGPATMAALHLPSNVTLDGAGNLYIADNDNSCIRKVNTSGIISTVAGGSYGYSGDGGPATAAAMRSPDYVITDGAGNLYISDQNNNCIRKVTVSGIISTIAGTGAAGFSGDGLAATAAKMYAPRGLAIDGAGNLYITDRGNSRIRKVDPSGIITTIAGASTPGYSSDGIPATASELFGPSDIALDGLGNMYIADNGNYRVRKVNASGIISTVAGTGVGSYNGDSCAATGTELYAPWGVTCDAGGNVLIAESINARIRKIVPGHAPAFTIGHAHSFTVCKNESAISIDSVLSVIDSDAHQSEIWSLLSAPLHGTAVIADTLVSTGGILMPTGSSYIANSGYAGYDTFKVLVKDCGGATDTVTMFVAVVNCALQITESISNTNEIYIYPNPTNDELNISCNPQWYHSITILNTLGQKMITQTISGGLTGFDIKWLPPGLYHVVLTGDKYAVEKFIKL